MKLYAGLLLPLTVIMVACGGGSPQNALISGIVTDTNGVPVRGANVTGCGKSSTTNTVGAYILDGVCSGEATVFATALQDGVQYTGRNAGLTFSGERTKNVNIVVARSTQFGRIKGTVFDNFGNTISKARVFAIASDGLSSYLTTADSQGRYDLVELIGGTTYTIRGSVQSYNNDQFDASVAAGNTRVIDLTLRNATNPNLPAPSNLSAIAWTAPGYLTRAKGNGAEYELIKKLIDPSRKTVASTRAADGPTSIEVDISFDPVNSTSLYGYGVYRQAGSSQSVAQLLRDPGANYYVDLESTLVPGVNYTYRMTSLNTNYPDTNNSESNFSNSATATPLGPIDFASANNSLNPTFQWSTASGATSYKVFVYSSYPSVSPTALWTSSSLSAGATSVAYTGPALQSGRTYYYFVFGQSTTGRAFSDIKSFNTP